MTVSLSGRLQRIRHLIRTDPAAALVAGLVLGPPPGLDPPPEPTVAEED